MVRRADRSGMNSGLLPSWSRKAAGVDDSLGGKSSGTAHAGPSSIVSFMVLRAASTSALTS